MNYRLLSRLTLAFIGLVTVLSVFFASRLEFNYDFDSFFPKGDPDLEYYLQYRDQFGNDNDYLLIGLDNQKSLFDSTFLTKVDSLTTFLTTLRDVKSVLSPTTASSPVIESFGVFEIPFLHPTEPEKYAQDSALIYGNQELVGTLFSPDGQSVSLAVQTTPDLAKEPGDTLTAAIRGKLAELGLEKYHLAGKVLAQTEIMEQMQWEVVIFMSASIVLVGFLLFFTFRSAWMIWVPMVVVLLSVVWCLGLMGFLEKPLDLLAVLLPTILFVVGMSDVVHILTRYLAEINQGLSKQAAILVTFKEVGLATFLTSVTTAVGFLTLMSTNVVPVQQFGLNTAISVFVAFFLAFTLLPAMLVLMKKPPSQQAATNNRGWHTGLRQLYRFVFRNQTAILVGSLVVVVFSAIGISQIRVDAHLLEDMSSEDQMVKDFEYFETHFAGVRPFELHLLPAPGHDIYSLPVLQEVTEIENYLLDSYGLHFISSPVTVVKTLNRALNGGSADYYRLPSSEFELTQVTRRLKQLRQKEQLMAVVSADWKQGRLSGKMSDVGSARAGALNDSLQTFLSQNIDPQVLQTRLTGSAPLLDKNNEYLTRNMLQGLLIAFLVVSLIVGLIYRSFVMIVIALIPNLIPLLVVGGLLGFADVTMKVSTSIIFTIAFGIAVDDTIHFISKLRLELLAGRTKVYALKRTMLSTGKAIVLTTLILMGGFMTMIASSFNSTFYIGLLISLTLLLAVITDLLLLPVLILKFYHPKTKQVKPKGQPKVAG